MARFVELLTLAYLLSFFGIKEEATLNIDDEV